MDDIQHGVSPERNRSTMKTVENATVRELLRLIALIVHRMLDKKAVDASGGDASR